MKKSFLWLLSALTVVLAGCSKNDGPETPENPITGLEVPASSADVPIVTGTEMTIAGHGFTESSEIWFEKVSDNQVKSGMQAGDNKIKAEIKSVDKDGIVVVTPEAVGKYSLILVQNNNSFTLGTVYLAAPVKKRIKSNTDATTNKEKTYIYEGDKLVKTVDADPSGSEETVFEYDSDGNLTSVTLTAVYDFGDGPMSFFMSKYVYEIVNKTAAEVVMTVKIYTGDESSLTETETLYLDANGLIDRVTTGTGEVKYTYDSKGNPLKEKLTSSSTGSVQEKRYTYDDKNSIYKNIAQPAKWWWVRYSPGFSFNPEGNNMTVYEQDSDGTNQFTFNYECDYDEDDYPTVIYYFSDNKKQIAREITYETVE